MITRKPHVKAWDSSHSINTRTPEALYTAFPRIRQRYSGNTWRSILRQNIRSARHDRARNQRVDATMPAPEDQISGNPLRRDETINKQT
jgi:hypothetical protein